MRLQLASTLSRDTRAVTLYSLCELFVRSLPSQGNFQDAATSTETRDYGRRSMDIKKAMGIHAQRFPAPIAGWVGTRFEEGVSARHDGAHINELQTVITRLALEMHDLSQCALAASADDVSEAWDSESPRQAYYRLINCGKLAREMSGEEQWTEYHHTETLDPSLPLPWDRPWALQ